MQRQIFLVSLIAAGVASSGHPAIGYPSAEAAERRFNEITAKITADHQSYPYMVQRYAIDLFHAGERERADEQFQNFRNALSKRSNTKIELIQGLINYAEEISTLRKDFNLPSGSGIEKYQEAVRNELPLHQKDKAKAEALVLEAGELIDSLPPYDVSRPREMTRVEEFYRKVNNTKLADEWSGKMDRIIEVALKSDSLTQNEVKMCLDLATSRAREGNFSFLRYLKAAPTPQSYEKTVGFIKQMQLLLEKLPSPNSEETSYVRAFYLFFQCNGKTELAETYKKKLEALLGSTDPNVLFPPQKHCGACGMG